VSAALPEPYLALCTGCYGQNPRCASCLGAQYVVRHPYAHGEQSDDVSPGDELADLIERVRAKVCPSCLLPGGQCDRCNGTGIVP
jgi:hypothetical protein